MITHIETEFEIGADPAEPVAADVALDGGCTEVEAQAMISTAWAQVEAFTGRMYRPVTSGMVIVSVRGMELFQWPRHPYPDAISVEILSNGSWIAYPELYVPGVGVELETHATYRLTQTGTVAGNTPDAHVIQAVANLAAYQLIQHPTRREFKSQEAGGISFTREAVMGVLYGSGAGAMLTNEVRL